MPNQRRFFRPRDAERGRHQSYRQPFEGEYAFRPDEDGQEGQAALDGYNRTTAELQAIIAECARDRTTLRGRGSLWSLSEVAVTDGRLIDTKALRKAFGIPAALVDPGYSGEANNLRFVECGNSIDALNRYLFRHGLSLKASGSNNGQTIAGALSTGTHGAAFNVGAVPEMVVGLHLVVGPDKHVYLERASQPVTTEDFARALGATRIQDDTLFNAALVSFGAFGVIHGIMIEARPLFILHALRFVHPYDAALKKAITTLDLSGLQLPASAGPRDNPYHFEVFYNPNEGTPPREAIVLMMFEEPWDPGYESLEWDPADVGPGASGLELMATLLELIPQPLTKAVVPLLNDQVRDQYAPYDKRGIIRDLFRGERVLGPTLGCGVGLELHRARDALEIAFKAYKDAGVLMPIILSHRFVKATEALLGFTHFALTTAVLEIDAINTPNTRRYLRQVWADLDAAGIAFTLHWGKFNSHLTPARVRRMYPAADQWIASREALLQNPEVGSVFANAFTNRLQLT